MKLYIRYFLKLIYLYPYPNNMHITFRNSFFIFIFFLLSLVNYYYDSYCNNKLQVRGWKRHRLPPRRPATEERSGGTSEGPDEGEGRGRRKLVRDEPRIAGRDAGPAVVAGLGGASGGGRAQEWGA